MNKIWWDDSETRAIGAMQRGEPVVLSFGEHQGKTLNEVPLRYLVWPACQIDRSVASTFHSVVAEVLDQRRERGETETAVTMKKLWREFESNEKETKDKEAKEAQEFREFKEAKEARESQEFKEFKEAKAAKEAEEKAKTEERGYLGFGCHKGQHVRDVDKNYLLWILEEVDGHASIKERIKELFKEESVILKEEDIDQINFVPGTTIHIVGRRRRNGWLCCIRWHARCSVGPERCGKPPVTGSRVLKPSTSKASTHICTQSTKSK